MILLFTDFGLEGPYLGQVRAAMYRNAPNVPVINLMADVPPFEVRGSGYLLAALVPEFPEGSVFMAVVDPGVGSKRGAVVMEADGRWFVAPDNGLLDAVARQSKKVRWWDITWRPARLTSTFHGRDLFAPVAARLGLGHSPEEIGCRPLARGIPDVPADWPRIIYIDWFGNLMTGMRASRLSHEHVLSIGGYLLKRADTFSDVEEGEPFWYENSIGLVEIAVNQDAADEILELDIGDPLEPQPVPHRR